VSLNGTQVVQDAQFLRAVSAQPLARGNEVNVLQFTVTRQHVSVAEAAAYLLTAFSSLPGSGTATIICGASGESLLTCTFSAVLEGMPKGRFLGTRTDLTFVLRGERGRRGCVRDGLRLCAGRDGGWGEFRGQSRRCGTGPGWRGVGMKVEVSGKKEEGLNADFIFLDRSRDVCPLLPAHF
jgi:hypothetical protein